MHNGVLGILAHVDAGKTTLSEAILYETGLLKRLGRVDRRDAFLDTDAQERERGITIFAKQAVFSLAGQQITLLDTPGHVDFSAEMERALRVMDCAVLVVSGPAGIQSHTVTLWRLLEHYRVPTLLFVNKMDLPGGDREAILTQLHGRFGGNFLDFGGPRDQSFWESAALSHEEALAEYLETGSLTDDRLRSLIARRALFPCWFGSALKLEGVSALLEGLGRYFPRRDYPENFSALVYKIENTPGGRLTHLKVTGGSLAVKDALTGKIPGQAEVWTEKVDQIRLYSGEKFRPLSVAPAGTLCAVTGLSHTYAGQCFGPLEDAPPPALTPLFTYQVLLPEGCDPTVALAQLRFLEAEDPQLHVAWNAPLREIHLHLMGQVQGEVLKRLIADRFGLSVEFGPGSVLYRETLAAPVLGMGHFEPLRHYAEVHLLLEPGEPGSGLRFESRCSTDALALNWQRLILGQLRSVGHPGVLTGSPITDLTVSLVAGRAHPKHTEGGDFLQAASRALRQGLMQGESILLEPWYDLTLDLPVEHLGRAIADIQKFGGRTQAPELLGDTALLSAAAPVAALGDYAAEVAAYTRGRGRLSAALGGYFPCRNQEEVVARMGYDPLRDPEHPADSIFCSHGAGHAVAWDEAPSHMHVSSGLTLEEGHVVEAPRPSAPSAPYTGTAAQDQELQAIFERTYGAIKTPGPRPMNTPKAAPALPDRVEVNLTQPQEEYLLVDGYNIIFAWDDLKAVAEADLDAARQTLIELMCNYQGFRQCRVILVFDAYKVRGGQERVIRHNNITVVYTKEAETADAYIEKATYRLGKSSRVRVATSDGLVQLIILGHGALRLSASLLREEVEAALGSIAALLRKYALPSPSRPVAHALERAREKEEQKP